MRSDIKAGRAYVELLLKGGARFVRGLRDAQAKLTSFGRGAMDVGKKLMQASGILAAPLAIGVKMFADFDDKMREVAAVSGATDSGLTSLTETAKRLGATTSYTAAEVASLMAELGRAGFDPTQIEDMTGAVLNLARATSTDATQASGIMAATIRQFGLEAGEATRVADGLTAAANKSFNTVEALGEALSYAGPVAADANMSLEETLAILGALGNVGIQGSSAGNAIRRLVTLTAAEADKMQSIFGVSFVDAAGNARPLVDALGEVHEATKNLGTAERAKKFNEAFGLLGITGASAIAKNAVGVGELLSAIQGAGGGAEETAKKMDSGIGGAFRILRSSIEGVAIAIGDALAPAVTGWAKVVQQFAEGATKIITENKEAVVSFARIVATVAGVGVAITAIGAAFVVAGSVFGGIAATISTVATVFGVIGGVISFLLSPLGLLIVAVGGLTAAWLYFTDSGRNTAEKVKSSFSGMIGTLKEIAGTASDTFSGIKDALMAGDFDLAGKIGIAGLRLAFLQGLRALTKDMKGEFGNTLRTIGMAIAEGDMARAWSVTVKGMAVLWDNFTTGIVAGIEEAIAAIMNVFIDFLDAIGKLSPGMDITKSGPGAVRPGISAGQMKANTGKDLRRTFDSIHDDLFGSQEEMRRRREEWRTDILGGSESTLDAAIDELTAELAALRTEAREGLIAPSVKAMLKDPGGKEGGGLIPGKRFAAMVEGSMSAAALVAQSAGGQAQRNPVVMELQKLIGAVERNTRTIEKTEKEMRTELDEWMGVINTGLSAS